MSCLWILYNSTFDTIEDNPAKRMLKEAITQQVDAELLYYPYFKIVGNDLYYKDELINELPRLVFIRAHEMWLVNYFESRGIRVINSAYTIVSCRDKWITHSIVDELNIPQIKTKKLGDRQYDDIVLEFGLPFILKYRSGSQGNSVYLIESAEQFYSVSCNIEREDYLLQEYITTSYGKDVRVYIVGDNVVGAVLRKNENGFMSNLAQGGLSYDYPLTDELINNSMSIKKALKGDIISVDYVFGKDGLLFCEANTNAGFASFNYLGYPMRELFIKYLKECLE